ncbi:Imm42 family immunity protein [Thiofilum flexile]|uniref:Imm42 family immunity protein n=1 Tax=Thiofilum flexile TaxID=125627 RepID=UPI0003802839|nr:Imm42 family immunity protein [Thiofilum flexile]
MLERELIGQKDVFAIEFEITSTANYIMGKIQIWIGGLYIGSFEDINILSVTLYQLNNIKTLTASQSLLKNRLTKIYYRVHLGKSSYDFSLNHTKPPIPTPYGSRSNAKELHKVSLGESFDDFSIEYYYDSSSIHFIWSLHENPYFEYPGYPNEEMSFSVTGDFFHRTVDEFENKLTFLQNLYKAT